MLTFEQVLDTAMQLSQDQRSMLAEILRNRQIIERRQEIATNAQTSLDLFKASKLKTQRADDLISELRTLLDSDDDLVDDTL